MVEPQADVSPEEYSQDIEETQVALSSALGLPVELGLINIETSGTGELVEQTELALAEVIEQVILETLQHSQLVSFSFVVGNPFVVNITVTTDLDPDSEEFEQEMRDLEAALSEGQGGSLSDPSVATRGWARFSR